MKSVKKAKKVVAGLLGVSMIFSLYGCGKKKEDFADYGNIQEEAGNDIQASNSVNDSDSKALSAVDSISDEVVFSDISWIQDSLSIKGVPTSAKVGKQSFDIKDRHIYEGQNVPDFKESEDRIIKSLFGDSAKKIEQLSYKDSSSYIPFLYKCQFLKYRLDHNTNYAELELSEMPYKLYQKPIKASTAETYKWVDNDEYSIHMYEGNYNNKRFGLILAYDYFLCTRYVFFEPISIEEYFPDCNYKTLNLSYAPELMEDTKNLENKCEYSNEEVKEIASDFLRETLDFGQEDLCFTDEGFLYSGMVWAIGMQPEYVPNYSNLDEKKEWDEAASREQNTVSLVFSDSDCVSTLANDGTYIPTSGYFRLTEQDYDIPTNGDIFNAAMDKNFENTTPDKDGNVPLGESINYQIDGYAVFLDSPFSCGDYSNIKYNTGAIKVTSNGLYSVDIIQNCSVTGVGEEAKLRSFDSIKESFLAEAEKELDLSEMKNPETLIIEDAVYLNYVVDYKDGKDDEDKKMKNEEENEDDIMEYREDPNRAYKFVPCWRFSVSSKNDVVADFIINASDGSLEELYYYDRNY